MTSRQKTQALIEQVRAIPDTDVAANPAMGMLLVVLEMGGPTLDNLIPADPAQLDELLLTGAAWALGLRSDDAPCFALVPSADSVAAELPA